MAYVVETRKAYHPPPAARAEHRSVSAEHAREFDDPQARERAAALYEALNLLSRCASLYTALHHAQASEDTGLSSTDIKALEMIAEFGSLTIGQLMHLTGLSAGGTTALVDRLEKAGMIARDRHPNDRRITVLRALSQQWPAALREALKRRLEVNTLGSDLSPEHCEALCGFLERSLDALRVEADRLLQDHGPAS